MIVFRWCIALLVGVGVTFLQFMAVAALNKMSSPPVEEFVDDKRVRPIVVAPPPKAVRIQSLSAAAPKASRPKATSAISKLQPSALPAIGLPQTTLGLGTNLGTLPMPSIGSVGVGSVDVNQESSEPDQPARAQRTVQPLYPVSAQRNGTEGYVIVRLSIDANGFVKDVVVVDSEPLGIFERSARDAARRFEFTPARVGGVAVPTTLEKKITFTLQ